MIATFKCLSNTAMFYADILKDGEVIFGGESTTVEITDNMAAGIGPDGKNDGAEVSCSLDEEGVIREYLDVNRFLEPDADEHRDHVVAAGESVVAKTHGANRQTLCVLGELNLPEHPEVQPV